MKILVTGAAGFIGSHLSERLINLGHEVVGVDCFTPYYDRVLKELNAEDVKAKGVTLFEKDLAKDDLVECVDGVEVIYHLAAQPGISVSTPFEDYLKNNIVATHRLLEALESVSSLRFFVNISTSSVYGKEATKAEDKTTEPASTYGVTKLTAEQMVLAANRDKEFPACSMRLFSVYGERERPEKLYPRVYRSLFTDDRFPYYEGSEHHIRSYTYVGDIVDGLTAVLGKFDVGNGEIFNIGTDEAISTDEGIRIVEDIIGKKATIKIVPKRAGDQQKTHANINKARKVLAYNPTTKPEDGLRKEVEWYEANLLSKNY